tara:strand:+ start:433 stop:579 length:147 start_codon:yes stop_codon:yes gene_type:complete
MGELLGNLIRALWSENVGVLAKIGIVIGAIIVIAILAWIAFSFGVYVG